MCFASRTEFCRVESDFVLLSSSVIVVAAFLGDQTNSEKVSDVTR